MVSRIGDRATFEALRRSRNRARRGPISVTYAVVAAAEEPAVAYALGRRTGGAVVRNRIRRRLRAAVAQGTAGLAPGAYLVSAGPEAAELPFEELRETLVAAMRQAGEARR